MLGSQNPPIVMSQLCYNDSFTNLPIYHLSSLLLLGEILPAATHATYNYNDFVLSVKDFYFR